MKKYICLLITFVIVLVFDGSARQNSEQSLGFVNFQEDVNAIVCNNKDELFAIKGSEGLVQLPTGRYCVKSWTLERTDKNGAVWKLNSKEIAYKKVLNVIENVETKLPVGEPVNSILKVRKENSEFYFRHYFKGQLDEEIELTKSRSRADPPKLLIKNEEGSYHESLSFRYG